MRDHHIVISFGLTVSLLMVSRCSMMQRTKELAEGLEELGDKLRRVVGQEVGRGSVRDYSMIKEY